MISLIEIVCVQLLMRICDPLMKLDANNNRMFGKIAEEN